MPEEAIAQISDLATRRAVMGLQAQMMQLFERTEGQIQNLSTKVDVHLSTCADERVHDANWRAQQIRSDEQFRQSVSSLMKDMKDGFTDILREMKEQFASHCEKDEEFAKSVARTFSRSQNWLIATLITLLLSSWGAIGIFVFHGLNQPR